MQRRGGFKFSPKSKELDPYIIGSSQGREILKPRLAMTKWWRDILARMSERRIQGWVATGYILLNSTKEDQEEFERNCKILKRKINKGNARQAHNWVVFESGPERRKYIIVGYPYTISVIETRNEIISKIIEDEYTEGARGVVVIGMNLNSDDYPYSIVATKYATNFFDSLSLDPN